jgi:hypothetical protein
MIKAIDRVRSSCETIAAESTDTVARERARVAHEYLSTQLQHMRALPFPLPDDGGFVLEARSDRETSQDRLELLQNAALDISSHSADAKGIDEFCGLVGQIVHLHRQD